MGAPPALAGHTAYPHTCAHILAVRTATNQSQVIIIIIGGHGCEQRCFCPTWKVAPIDPQGVRRYPRREG